MIDAMRPYLVTALLLIACTHNNPPFVEGPTAGVEVTVPSTLTLRAIDPEGRPIAYRWLIFDTELGSTDWVETWEEEEYWYSTLTIEQELLNHVAESLLEPPAEPVVRVAVADGRANPVIASWPLPESSVELAFSESSAGEQ